MIALGTHHFGEGGQLWWKRKCSVVRDEEGGLVVASRCIEGEKLQTEDGKEGRK